MIFFGRSLRCQQLNEGANDALTPTRRARYSRVLRHMAVETPEANAVVYCAAGVYRAGCVVRPGVASVRGVARRTTRRVVRRSDMMLKHDISLLGHLDNGLGFYRFSYNGSDKAYVCLMAQEVQTVMPAAVLRRSDGHLP